MAEVYYESDGDLKHLAGKTIGIVSEGGATENLLDMMLAAAAVPADKVQRQVREFEPKIAVFSGQEGMDIYRRLIPQAHDALRPGGWFVAEIGFSTEAKVKELLPDWAEVRVTADLQGIPRVIAARKK